MIQSEKDRLEILRLAVQLLMPKAGNMTPAEARLQALENARQFNVYVRGEGNAEQR